MPKIKQLTALGNSAIIGLSSIVLSAVSLPAQAINLVQNGNFESNGGLGAIGGTASLPAISYATNWTVGPVDTTGTDTYSYTPPFVFMVDDKADSTGFRSVFGIIKVHGPANGVNNGFTGSPNGGYFLGMDGDYARASVYQDITGMTVGQNYILTGQYALGQFNEYTGGVDGKWEIQFGSDRVSTNTLNIPSQGFSGWQNFSQTFTATAATQRLEFFAKSTPSGLPPFLLLDGVSLQEEGTPPTPVPFETDALPIVGSMIAFGFGLRAKQKLAQKKLVKFE
ncbi:hypothetical protein [Dolichospermum flos-aquae]|uniref:Uncharacterized protein n=1 Tax=Dolichospermum flos-aquae LEGE 04289 TaxID=1828708 RepID=A0ACC5Q7S0_DOLFA|nr:hypothetical protein [Dolichospermum flos-aquae]MBE9220150.1 hypothetical protein [Dolichospermum flos-aquae LEGE 04289]